MRRTVGRVLLAAVAVGLLGATGGTPIARDTSTGRRAVIVQGPNAASAVRALGGTPTLALDLIGGVGATVPTSAIAHLEAEGLIVSPDATAHVVSDSYGNPTGSSLTSDSQTLSLGLTSEANAGHGVAVALVDTGVANTPDLNGRLVRGPDYSGEHDGIDHYGHGTFMAGLIAGDGTGSPDGRIHRGIAPGATVVSIKVAGADGTTSLSKVIAGIGWAVVHEQDLGIRVLNLSVGVDPVVGYRQDPLSAAVEVAWSSGLTTVVAAGNDGAGTVTAPGRDPYVLTVGAADNSQSSVPAEATMPAWSGTASFEQYAKPDVLAPGVSVVSLRAPGSTIDMAFPDARVDRNYFRGSGTSMSTALMSGIAAIVIQHHPNAVPDDVKGAITSTASAMPNVNIAAGEVNLTAALAAQADPGWEQNWATALPWLRMPWERGGWSSTRWSSTRWSSTEWWSSTRWSSTRWSSWRWDQVFESTRWSDAAWDSTRWSSTRWSTASWGDSQP